MKLMKKYISFVLSAVLVAVIFCGCSVQNADGSDYSDEIIVEQVIIDNISNNSSTDSLVSSTPDDTQNELSVPQSEPQQTSSESVPSDCSHDYAEKIEQNAEFFKAGSKKYVCKNCGDSYTQTYPVEKIKLLAIGNSFSLNSMWNLYDLLKSAGVKEIDIAIMYIGGCSLDKHWECVQKNSTEYQLYRNNSGNWEITNEYTIEQILSEKDWDIISLQQKSEHAGDETKFSNLDNMVNYVSDKCPDSTIVWNMTWAFTNDSIYMPNQHLYNYNDITMYKKIAECAQNKVVPSQRIKGIVPVGTAVMNARTSKLKNMVHQDDGSHLSEGIGYFVGAYTWCGYLTGMPLYDINLFGVSVDVSSNIDVIRESAQNALDKPYEITQSYYTN